MCTNIAISKVKCKETVLLGLLWILALLVFSPSVLAVNLVEKKALSPADESVAEKAMRAVKDGRWSSAKKYAAQANDPVVYKTYLWLSLTKRPDKHSFEEFSSFIRSNGTWPRQTRLRMSAEDSMPKNMPKSAVLVWFDAYPPKTSDGMERYLDALFSTGHTEKARSVLAEWWRTANLKPLVQARFLANYGLQFTNKAHQERLDYILVKKHYTNARALVQVLGHPYKSLVKARIALAEDQNGVDSLVSAVPQELQDDPGLLYERIRWRRRQDKDFSAIELLHHATFIHKDMGTRHVINRSDWWRERHILVRRLIEDKKFDSAYLLASSHHQTEGLPFAQAEFLSGWLALRFVDRPWEAFEHFEKLYNNVSTPVSRARAAYWAGRASEALAHTDVARAWYQVAAHHQTTFYGQLSLAKLPEGQRPPQQLPPEPEMAVEKYFYSNELVKAAVLLNKAGLRKDVTRFLSSLADNISTQQEYVLVADLSRGLDHFHNAIRIAKDGLKKNIFLMDHAYPTALKHMRRINTEWALVHALIRQESQFDFDARSHAGARGLMQLMPATAKEVAHKHNIPHRTQWLTSLPDHNVLLGSLYLDSMLKRFDGSYALALAAYNGGPGRVSRWLRENGDPRKGDVDLIDWIEMIPVYETRNYVQRVLEGTYVYRIKLRDVQKSSTRVINAKR